MRVFVKICGLRAADTLRVAIEAGADAVGFVLAESPRRVTLREAVALAALVPAGIVRVAVLRHPDAQLWQAVLDELAPDWVQSDAADFAGRTLPPGIEALPVYRDLPGLDSAQLAREDRFLFEAATSGVGAKADWDRAAVLARQTRLVLAGGIDAGNVGEAIRHVHPWGVDVSSGVESSRGVKDPQRIRAFITAVRRAEQDNDRADR